MKSIQKSIIVLAFVVIFQLQLMKVEGIRCFQCNSNNNSGCTNLENYKRNLFYPIPCEDYEGRAAFCRKTVIQVLDKVKQNEKRVIRSCGYIPYKNPCYKTDNEGHTEQVCQCFEDGCNSANTIAMSTVLLSTTFLLTKAIY